MKENELWERFAANGSVGDYLEYRKFTQMKTELTSGDENKCGGFGDKRTDCR